MAQDFSPEELERLTWLWEQGYDPATKQWSREDVLSTAEIGRRMGRTKSSIVGKAHRLDLPGRPTPIKRDPNKPPRQEGPRVRSPRTTLAPPPSILAHNDPPPPEPAPPPAPPKREAKTPEAAAPARKRPPCCWPIGMPGTIGFRFCGEPSEVGRPYCPDHVKLGYVKIDRPRAG